MRLLVTDLTTSGIPLTLGDCFSTECVKSQVWQPRRVLWKPFIVLFKQDNILIIPNELSICTTQPEHNLSPPKSCSLNESSLSI